MLPLDIIILGLSAICAIVFFILGAGRLIKLYIGLLLGLLVCLLINLKLNYIADVGTTSNMVDYFLSKNRTTFSTIAILAIPVMGVLFSVNNTLIVNSKETSGSLASLLATILFSAGLVPFVLALYSMIGGLGLSNNDILASILDGLKNSSLSGVFSDYSHYIFLLLLAILLYKFVLRFLFMILVYFFTSLRELRAEEREIRKREESDEDEEEDEHDTKHY